MVPCILGYRVWRRKSSLAGGLMIARAVKQPLSKMPPGSDTQLVLKLPAEILWPHDDEQGVIACIEAMHGLDVPYLHQLTDAFPHHRFGFEDEYLPWAEEQQAAQHHAPAVPPGPRHGPDALYPLARLATAHPGVVLDLHLATYANQDAWVQATWHHQRSILSRAMIDPSTNRYRVTIHYPGRYEALGVSQTLIQDALGPSPQKLGRIAPARETALAPVERERPPAGETDASSSRRQRAVPLHLRPHPAASALGALPAPLGAAG